MVSLNTKVSERKEEGREEGKKGGRVKVVSSLPKCSEG